MVCNKDRGYAYKMAVGFKKAVKKAWKEKRIGGKVALKGWFEGKLRNNLNEYFSMVQSWAYILNLQKLYLVSELYRALKVFLSVWHKI